TIATTATGTNTFYALLVNAGAGGVDITGSTTVGPGGATDRNGYMAVSGATTVTLQSGGSLTINGSGTTNATDPNSIIGQNTTGTSTLLVNGGTLTVGANNGFLLGNGNNNNIAANGVLTISSGTATINRGTVGTTGAGTDTRLIKMGVDSNSATGTINLNGGTLATDRQFVRDGSNTNQSGIANFVFNGGTLKALGTQTDWLQSTTATSAGQNQGASGGTVNANALALSSVTTTAVSTIDSNSFSVAINNVISGTGGFNINSSTGTGTVNLGGANSYTGPTTVSAGRLNVISPGSINTSAVSLGAGTLGGNGTLGAVTVNNTGAVISNGNATTDTLNLGSLTFTTGATLNLNKANDTSTAALAITGNLATTSGITINIPAGPVWTNGDYKLISFGSGPAAGPTPHLAVGSIVGLGGRQSGTLSSTGSSIILTIGGETPVWTGVGSQIWTTAATNNNTGPNAWALKTGHTATNFWANDSVEFNDTYRLNPSPSDVTVSNSTVTIHGGVAPASVTFNNTNVNYVINSDDSTGITTGALSMNGGGNVTLTTTNSYTGPTIITAGTLTLGDGTTNGSIATSSNIANDGTLVFNRTGGSFSYANVISGSGSVVKNGTGTQIFSGSNTYFGSTTITGGTVQVGSGGTTGTLGSGAITFTNNAALVFNRTNGVVQGTDFGFIDGTGSVTQAGSGSVTLSYSNSYTGGTNIASGTLIVGATDPLGIGLVTLAGGTLSGSASDVTLANALVAQASTTSVLFTSGKNLTINGNLTGSGNINRTATGIPATVFLGGDNSGFSGTFTVDANTSAATRFTAATAGSQAAKWVINQSFNSRASLEFTGGTIKFGSLTGTGFLTSSGANAIEVGALGVSETFSGVLNQGGTGTLAVTKVGAGTWTLTGANTYTGDTTVNAGVLAVNGNAIANANKLVLNGGKVDAMGATEVVGTLYFGAAQQAAGTWGATGSGAAHIDDTHFSGTGLVSVTTAPVAGYTTWADANGATGQTVDQDHDNDGVKNGIEYFMGQTGSTFTANPA
ncbi:autotransporter-associated beta strand repeat-containing protein, partial [Flavobacterium sp.]|uniref:beta strand repeat-containing protein n=1 Tax=Flavobacterium sp. TaxID=239 RepID=UPI00326635A7